MKSLFQKHKSVNALAKQGCCNFGEHFLTPPGAAPSPAPVSYLLSARALSDCPHSWRSSSKATAKTPHLSETQSTSVSLAGSLLPGFSVLRVRNRFSGPDHTLLCLFCQPMYYIQVCKCARFLTTPAFVLVQTRTSPTEAPGSSGALRIKLSICPNSWSPTSSF